MKGKRASKNERNNSIFHMYRRIIIVVIELILVVMVLSFAKNFIKDKDEIKVLVNSNNVNLKYEAFVENRKSIFIYGRY